MSLYLTTMRGCASIKSYPLYPLIVQVASILKCNDTRRIRRKDSHQRYRHHVRCSSYVLCGSAHRFLQGLAEAHRTFIHHSANCSSQQSWVTAHASWGRLMSIHTDFQSLGRLGSISYLETDHGPTAENRWSITVKSKRMCPGS
jgi:hypothetical protein